MHNSKIIYWSKTVLSVWIVLIAAFSVCLFSCFEETFESNVNYTIETSVDTLRFDTVFTSVGSITRSIKIYNPTDQNINLSSIRLTKGNNSMFRINVDGIPGNESMEIPILSGDSLYVFVEVTVNPDQPLSLSPFVISEELLISSGEGQKVVTLEAWGQNANYFPSRDAKGQLIGLSCRQGTLFWDDPKPYVIYGLLFIDSCTLVIPPGTKIFVHGGLARVQETIFADGGLVFLPEGQLMSQGTAEKPVIFQGDRLEEEFADVRGQWSGLRFLAESQNHRLDHTVIKNSIVGIRADSASSVILNSVTVANTSNIGIIGIHATIEADNTLVHSNGPQSVALVYGGSYRFRYCTLANFENQSPALYMDNFNCLTPDCSVVAVHPLNAVFLNSIIMGSNDDEIDIADVAEGMDKEVFNIVFDHTLIKVQDAKDEYSPDACISCLEHSGEPVFLDEFNDIYLLDTMSVARDQGNTISDLTLDNLGNIRDSQTPDIGCFEFIN